MKFFAQHEILYKKQGGKRLRTAGKEFKWFWLSMLLAFCHLNIVWHCKVTFHLRYWKEAVIREAVTQLKDSGSWIKSLDAFQLDPTATSQHIVQQELTHDSSSNSCKQQLSVRFLHSAHFVAVRETTHINHTLINTDNTVYVDGIVSLAQNGAGSKSLLGNRTSALKISSMHCLQLWHSVSFSSNDTPAFQSVTDPKARLRDAETAALPFFWFRVSVECLHMFKAITGDEVEDCRCWYYIFSNWAEEKNITVQRLSHTILHFPSWLGLIKESCAINPQSASCLRVAPLPPND